MTTFNQIQKNAEKIERNLTKEREERCEPVAQKVLEIVGNSKLPLLPSKDRAEFVKTYDPIVMQIVELLRETKLPLQEWGYTIQLALVSLDHIKNYVNETINKNTSEVLAEFWGKEEGEVTMEDLALKKKDML